MGSLSQPEGAGASGAEDLGELRKGTAEGRPTCFVGYYGLDRSLRWTAPSIERNIVAPLREFGFRIHTAAHFNLPSEIRSERSRERGVPASKSPHGLSLQICWLEPQDESLVHIESEGNGPVLFGSGDSTAEWQTRRNLALQLHSLRRLWELCQLLGADRSDLFVLVRPDLEYIDRLDVAQIYGSIKDGGADLITPEWQQWDGLNDRFAFCSARGAASYCQRLNRAQHHIAERGGQFHAETFLKWIAERDHLHLDFCKLRAMRVRANGKTWREEFELDFSTNARALTRVYRYRFWSWLRTS